jgi:threonine synthase
MSTQENALKENPSAGVALRCIEPACGQTYSATEVRTHCDRCRNLLDVVYQWSGLEPAALQRLWEARKISRAPQDLSGVWRFREIIPFLPGSAPVITLREGNTPLLDAPRAAAYAGLDAISFKHQGFNPTGSFKDNGMTAGVSQGAVLGKKTVACASTGNTSASMAAFAAAGGLQAVIFIPAGQIAAGKLAQALEYGALTIQVDANFDVTLKLLFELAAQADIYLLNSVNPFRVEGQKTIMVELMEQLAWEPPDWIILPGGNLGNCSAFGKGLRELFQLGLIPRLPRLAVIQAEGAAPLYNLLQRAARENRPARELTLCPVDNPQTLATAIKIGAPASWKKALRELDATRGVCETVSDQELADAKAVIGQAGIGCEPASAASLAGARKLVAKSIIKSNERVIGILTGNLLKDPDYVLGYHQGSLTYQAHDGPRKIQPRFANQPLSVPPDLSRILTILSEKQGR